ALRDETGDKPLDAPNARTSIRSDGSDGRWRHATAQRVQTRGLVESASRERASARTEGDERGDGSCGRVRVQAARDGATAHGAQKIDSGALDHRGKRCFAHGAAA